MASFCPTHTLRVYMVGEQMGDDDDDDDGGSWLMSCLLTNVKLLLIFTSAVKCVGVGKDKSKYKTRKSNSTWLDLLHAEVWLMGRLLLLLFCIKHCCC